MQTPLTVFQVIPVLTTGGAERLVVNLLLHLDRFRYNPICVSLNPPAHTHYEKILHEAGIAVHYLNKRRPADPAVYLRFHNLFCHYRPIVVHTHLGGLNYAYPLAILHRTPVRVHTLHNIAQQTIHWRAEGRFVQNLALRKRWGNFVLVAIAEEVRETIRQVYGYPDPPLIPNGIPVDEYCLDSEVRRHWRNEHGFSEEDVLLVCVARFSPQKNHPLLISAFAKIAHPTAHLLLVGGGELESTLRQQVESLQIHHRVHLLGVRADIPQILNASDLFVLSSLWEGNPMSVQEAMASGLPVVATAVGGVPELVVDGETGLLVPPDDEPALVEALNALICNPDQRLQMAHQARQRAREHFDIRQTVRAYEQLYTQILDK